MIFSNAGKLMQFADPAMQSGWKSTEMFMKDSLYLEGCLNHYAGTDFCSGLMFGLRGSEILIKIGKEIERAGLIM